MTRLLELVTSPYHVHAEEAEGWLRGEAAALATAEGVRRVVLSPLGSPSVRLDDRWGWLLELDCDGSEGASRVVRDGAWTSLLGDLRLLGMRPLVAVVGDGSELRS
jgi:hypothetical protein